MSSSSSDTKGGSKPAAAASTASSSSSSSAAPSSPAPALLSYPPLSTAHAQLLQSIPRWQTDDRKVVLKRGAWLSVEEHSVKLPNGKTIKDWTWIESKHFVNVVCEKERKRVVMDSGGLSYQSHVRRLSDRSA
jgi:hypothetical protein